MKNSDKFLKEVEKAFSTYVRYSLNCTSRKFFYKYYKDSNHLRPLYEVEKQQKLNITVDIHPYGLQYYEKELEYESLSQAIQSLSDKEKRLLYMKFCEEKTDRQIAVVFGVTRQAVTKSRLKLLDRLKSQMQ